jgi:hypothetical protein
MTSPMTPDATADAMTGSTQGTQIRKILLAVVWLGFLVYAFGFAPPDRPETFDLIVRMSTGDWDGINPTILALFNLMGVWPMVYACLALVDGHGQRLWAWPFVLGSFALGAFLLMPYLVLRQPNPDFQGEPSRLLKLTEGRWLGRLLALTAIAFLGYGFVTGDWADFIQQWQTSRFIHVMSLDFCLLWLLVPTLLGDDMARRGLAGRPGLLAAIALVPLLGITVYLAFRPPLSAPADSAVST